MFGLICASYTRTCCWCLEGIDHSQETSWNEAFDHEKLKMRLQICSNPKPKMILEKKTYEQCFHQPIFLFHRPALTLPPQPTLKRQHSCTATFISLFFNFGRWLLSALLEHCTSVMSAFRNAGWLIETMGKKKKLWGVLWIYKEPVYWHETLRKPFYINGAKPPKKKNYTTIVMVIWSSCFQAAGFINIAHYCSCLPRAEKICEAAQ